MPVADCVSHKSLPSIVYVKHAQLVMSPEHTVLDAFPHNASFDSIVEWAGACLGSNNERQLMHAAEARVSYFQTRSREEGAIRLSQASRQMRAARTIRADLRLLYRARIETILCIHGFHCEVKALRIMRSAVENTHKYI